MKRYLNIVLLLMAILGASGAEVKFDYPHIAPSHAQTARHRSDIYEWNRYRKLTKGRNLEFYHSCGLRVVFMERISGDFHVVFLAYRNLTSTDPDVIESNIDPKLAVAFLDIWRAWVRMARYSNRVDACRKAYFAVLASDKRAFLEGTSFVADKDVFSDRMLNLACDLGHLAFAHHQSRTIDVKEDDSSVLPPKEWDNIARKIATDIRSNVDSLRAILRKNAPDG